MLQSINQSVGKITRDASIRYSVSVSAPIRTFSADRVSVRRDRSKSDIVRILFCVIVEPHERHTNIIKQQSFRALYFKCSEALP